MTVKLPRIRPYFSQCFVLLSKHQYNCNITKSFLSVDSFWNSVICTKNSVWKLGKCLFVKSVNTNIKLPLNRLNVDEGD